MSRVVTTVTVSYREDGLGGDGAILSLQSESEVKPPYGTAYARLFKSPEVAPSLKSTGLGNPYIVNTGLTQQVTETIAFNGSATAQLQYPIASLVMITSQGVFLDLTGTPILSLNVTVNTKAGGLQASQPCYGFVLVRYSTTYSRISGQFSPLNPGLIDPNTLDTEFAPLTFLAFYQTKSSSVTVQPPNKNEKPGGKRSYFVGREDSEADRLIMELNPAFPVSVSPTGGGTKARAVFFVYPGEANPVIQTTSGQTWSVDAFGGVLPGVVYGSSTVSLKEPLSFTNSMSVSVKYPPASSVVVTASGDFYSVFGSTFSANFVTRLGFVNMVNWVSSSSYSIAGTKQVRDNEVFVCMPGDLAIQATGVAVAEYATTRRAYVLEWDKSGDWFPSVTLFASSIDGKKGELKIEPPPRRGTL
jgi:hypothetical protein